MSAPATRSGQLWVVAAPSGAGKTSLVKALVERDPSLKFSISYTTRAPRASEVDGRDYFFVSKEKFIEMANDGAFLEHACVFDNWYGTGREHVAKLLATGSSVVLEIDWQGARQVRERAPDSHSIFVLPPSVAELNHIRIFPSSRRTEPSGFRRMDGVRIDRRSSASAYTAPSGCFSNRLPSALVASPSLNTRSSLVRVGATSCANPREPQYQSRNRSFSMATAGAKMCASSNSPGFPSDRIGPSVSRCHSWGSSQGSSRSGTCAVAEGLVAFLEKHPMRVLAPA